MTKNLTETDPELAAMGAIRAALEPLDDAAKGRVIDWVVGKFGISKEGRAEARTGRTAGDSASGEPAEEAVEFSDFADLCSAASPTTDAQKALVAGYWFQVCEGQQSFASQECNSNLKHFGDPISNITRAFDSLKRTTPRLAIQVHKGGKTKQARKRYKLTHQGIEEVKRMLNG